MAAAFFIASPALAQEVTVSPSAEPFAEEGITDDDLTANLEAEVLPTDGFSYRWERIKFGLRRAFVFNAEKKAELDRAFLHRLDRKLEACTETGDEECAARVQAHIDAAKARHEQWLERREELKEKHLEQFQAWRERREARREELQEKLEERKAHFQELRNEWLERRQEIRERRQEDFQEIKENIGERRDERRDNIEERIETRQENREQILEQRSQRVKDRLDNTRAKVLERERPLPPRLVPARPTPLNEQALS